VGASAAMDGESEADTQRAEAGRAEANVKREGTGSHEPDWAHAGMAREPSRAHDRLEGLAALEVHKVAHGLGGDRFEGVACEERLVGRDDHVWKREQA
jgi:hypothetical protein